MPTTILVPKRPERDMENPVMAPTANVVQKPASDKTGNSSDEEANLPLFVVEQSNQCSQVSGPKKPIPPLRRSQSPLLQHRTHSPVREQSPLILLPKTQSPMVNTSRKSPPMQNGAPTTVNNNVVEPKLNMADTSQQSDGVLNIKVEEKEEVNVPLTVVENAQILVVDPIVRINSPSCQAGISQSVNITEQDGCRPNLIQEQTFRKRAHSDETISTSNTQPKEPQKPPEQPPASRTLSIRVRTSETLLWQKSPNRVETLDNEEVMDDRVHNSRSPKDINGVMEEDFEEPVSPPPCDAEVMLVPDTPESPGSTENQDNSDNPDAPGENTGKRPYSLTPKAYPRGELKNHYFCGNCG